MTLVGFALWQNGESVWKLEMAKRFSGWLAAAGDRHLLAKPKSPRSATGICFSMLGQRSQWDGGAVTRATG